MTGAVSVSASVRTKSRPRSTSQFHMPTMTRPAPSFGGVAWRAAKTVPMTSSMKAWAPVQRPVPAAAVKAVTSVSADRPVTITVAAGKAPERSIEPSPWTSAVRPSTPARAGGWSAATSAASSARTTDGTTSVVGSVTSWPAMSARASRPARVSADASQAATIEEVSGASSGTGAAASSSEPESPLPAQASRASAWSCQSRKRSGDGGSTTGTIGSSEAWSWTPMPTDASARAVASRVSGPKVAVRMASTRSTEA